MRRRLYFLLPTVDSARQIVNELLLARIDEHHIHVLARDDIPIKDLPPATLLQRSDLIHGLEMGLIVGGITGALAGIIASLVPATGMMSGGVILVCAIAGAVVGAWASGMISTDVRNTRLRSFEPALARGEVLLMVDTPKERVDLICDLVRSHHEAHLEGSEPTIPAFP